MLWFSVFVDHGVAGENAFLISLPRSIDRIDMFDSSDCGDHKVVSSMVDILRILAVSRHFGEMHRFVRDLDFHDKKECCWYP